MRVHASPRVQFDWQEGEALRFLDILLGRGRPDALLEPVTLDPIRPELLHHGAARIARGCVRWLVEGGGWRVRRVLRGGRRVEGRAWDPTLGEGFALRFTDASRALWLDGMAVIPGLIGRGGAREGGEARTLRRALGALIPRSPTATGDWVLGAAASEVVPGLRLAARDEAALRRALRAMSPLETLLRPSSEETPEGFRAAAARLVEGADARVLECAGDRVARAWSDRAAALMRADEEATASGPAWAALGDAMRALCEAADARERGDLCRPAMRALQAMLGTSLAAGGEALRARFSRARGITSMRERDALLDAVGRVAGVGAWLIRQRASLAAERYGDPRYAEAQVFVGDFDAILGPVRRELEGLSRALSSELG